MTQFFRHLFGTADDFRALVKAGISRLISIFAFYVAGHLAIAFIFHQWMFVGHAIWTFIGWYGAWYFVWRVGNRTTDVVVVASADGNHRASYLVERVRRFFAVIVITGIVFFYIPTYQSFTLTLAACMCLLLYALSGPAWDWDRWYKVSLWSVIGLILGLILKALDFSTFFDDPRNGFDSFPWQWVVFLLLIILALTAIESFLPKRTGPAPTGTKEIKHEH